MRLFPAKLRRRRRIDGRLGAVLLVCLALVLMPGGEAMKGRGRSYDEPADDDGEKDSASAEMPGERGPYSIRNPNYNLVPDDKEHDYFGFLGVPRLASVRMIRSAFRQMAYRFRQHLMGSVPDVERPRTRVGLKGQNVSHTRTTAEREAGGKKLAAETKRAGEARMAGVVYDDDDEKKKGEEDKLAEPVSETCHKKNSDAIQAFIQATEAYRVLTDRQDKRMYEVAGSDGLRKAARGPRFEDPLRDAYKLELGFKTGSFVMEYGFKPGQKKSTGNVHHNIKIPLIGFYTGFHMDVAIVRAELCQFCNGTGAAENAEMLACTRCAGAGKLSRSSHWRSKQAIRQRKEGGIDQTITVGCSRCQGSGKMPSEPCPRCKGEKTLEGKHTVTIHVEPGMLEGHAFTFKEQAEQAPDAVAGDVVLHVGSEEHPDFEREGNDLVTKRNVTLAEALLGFQMEVRHLDGRLIVIERNEVTKPGQDHEVPGLGMPIHGKPGQFGKLIVRLNIVFPERIAVDEDRARNLRKADERAKKRRSRGFFGMFGEGEGEDEDVDKDTADAQEEEGQEDEEDKEEDEEEQQQDTTRRKRRSRAQRSHEQDPNESPNSDGAKSAGTKSDGVEDQNEKESGPSTATRQTHTQTPPSPQRPPSTQTKLKGVGMYMEHIYAQKEGEKVQVGLRVKGLLPGSPAELSGQIMAGDSLSRVGDVDVGAMKLKDLAPLLLGPEGSVVSLTLVRQDSTVYEIDLVRGDPVVPKKDDPQSSTSS